MGMMELQFDIDNEIGEGFSYIHDSENPLEIRNDVDAYEEWFNNPHERHLSISLEEVSPIPLTAYPSRKTSIDVDSFVNSPDNVFLDSPVATTCDVAKCDQCEMPPLQLTPTAFSLSLSDLVTQQLIQCRADQCKKRRKIRMEILRRKRQEGCISFDPKVRYEQRSEFALKRVRSKGRFISEIEYRSVDFAVC